jgi:hypothetical protein
LYESFAASWPANMTMGNGKENETRRSSTRGVWSAHAVGTG